MGLRGPIWAIWDSQISRWSFQKQFTLVSHLYFFTCSLELFLEVVQSMGLWGHVWPRNRSKCSFGVHFLKQNPHMLRIIPVLYSHWDTCRGVFNMGLIGMIFGSFGVPWYVKNSALRSFSPKLSTCVVRFSLNTNGSNFYRSVEYRPQNSKFLVI